MFRFTGPTSLVPSATLEKIFYMIDHTVVQQQSKTVYLSQLYSETAECMQRPKLRSAKAVKIFRSVDILRHRSSQKFLVGDVAEMTSYESFFTIFFADQLTLV